VSFDLARKRQLEEFQRRLGIKFSNLELFDRALTHISYAKSLNKEDIPYNERLEFLGDAVLELVVAEYLFRRYPNSSEGDLSKLRSIIVSEEALSYCARKIKVGDYLLVGKDQEEIRSQSALLADAYEAIIGALYLDGGLEVVRDFILRILLKEEEKIKEIRDFKSRLQEYTQSLYKSVPEYETVQEVGPDHNKTFKVRVKVEGRVLGEGWGSTKRKAEKMAAKCAWEKIEQARGEK